MSIEIHESRVLLARPGAGSARSLERWAALARRALGTPEAWITPGARPAPWGASGGALLVADLRAAPPGRRPAVEVPRNAVAYAEAPIHDARGRMVGWLSVMETRPRGWTSVDAAILEDVAAAAGMQLALWAESRSRARAEAALERSEAKFRSVFDSAAVGIAMIGADGWLIRTNGALQRMLGGTEDELRGRLILDFLHPDEHPAVLGAFERIVRGEAEHHQAEHRLLRPDGRGIWGQVTASLVRDPSQRPLFALAMVADVTERREAQLALSESQRQLMSAQRMEAVGRLAGGVAHDFNNLLTAIGSFAQLVQLELEPGSETAGYVGEIRRAADRATNLTRQLLAFSRQQILRPRRLDLNGVVTEAQPMLRRLAGEGVELVPELDPRLPAVNADPGQIEQVIMNLVVNARDAMPRGGRVRVRTSTLDLAPADARAHPHRIPAGRYARVVVADTGHGMDRDTMARIFEPFFTTKEPGKGTGLGLSTVYGIVQQSGGQVAVDSEPGRGTTFTIYLPALDEPPPAAERPGAPAAGAGAETVLLVEDEDTVRFLAERILRRQGYTVLAAARADEALRLFEQHRDSVDLLVTDMEMPGINGRTLAERLRSRVPALRVLFMSGYPADPADPPGAAPHLEKPFTPDLLARAVRAALDG